MKKSIVYLFSVLMLAMVVSCGGDSSKDNPDDEAPGSNVLSGKIDSWGTFLSGKSLTTGSGVFAQVVILDHSSSITAVVSNQCVIESDGSFSLTLLDPASTYLYDVASRNTSYGITSVPSSGVSIFNSDDYNVSICLFKASVYSTALPAAADSLGALDFSSTSNKDIAYLDYASAAVSFTGSNTSTDGSGYTYTSKCDGTKQPKGWCLTYCDVTNITSSSETDTYRYSRSFSKSGYVWSAK
jgi:hypothetical protein